ncbi:hypothetical protein [Bradyrhizobium oligotrophicum]|uniref:hypothetical protein n=1 Tax=Bradyrhizobium oligotrophicum TaxID=44255 RepID=UPI003EBCD64E
MAIAFQDRLVGRYSYNKSFYSSNDFEFVSFNSGGFIERLETIFGRLKHSEHSTRMLIDISSMSRPMIASVVLALAEACKKHPLDVVFSYCPAIFTKPSDLRQPVTVSQPVIPEFAGWSNQPDKPVAAIAGLGFEFDQALGAIEFLEPAVAWTFIPYGEDVRYDRAVQNANKELLNALNPDKIIRYDVADPYRCFAELESLSYGLLDTSRPIIIPFGPKIFSLLSFLVAAIHLPHVTVWRVSGEQVGTPDDRIASGNVISVSALFTSPEGS